MKPGKYAVERVVSMILILGGGPAFADPEDIVTIIQRPAANESSVFVATSPTSSSQWARRAGPGNEFGFLAGNFDGAGDIGATDEIAAICFSGSGSGGDGQVLVTKAPGNQAGALFRTLLVPNRQASLGSVYRLLSGDFNGDGKADIGTLSAGGSGDLASDARLRITFGPDGQSQQNDGARWLIPNGARAAVVAGDFLANDDVDDLAVISPGTSSGYVARFVRGPFGVNDSTSWSFATSSAPIGFRSGDINGDGLTDLIGVFAGNNGQHVVEVLFGENGARRQGAWVLQVPPSAVPLSVIVADTDDDNKDDVGIVFQGSAGNAAVVSSDPSLGRALRNYDLRTEANNRVQFLSGDFATTANPLTCPVGQALDLCGVCGGKNECLGCKEVILTEVLSGLTKEFILLKDLALKSTDVLRRDIRLAGQGLPENTLRRARTIIKRGREVDARYNLNVGDIYARIPGVVQSCPSNPQCVQTSNAALIQQYRTEASQMLSIVQQAQQFTRRQGLPKRVNQRKRLDRAKRTQALIENYLKQIPAIASTCR